MTPAVTEPSPQSDLCLSDMVEARKSVPAPIPLMTLNGVLGTQGTNQTPGKGDRPGHGGSYTGSGLHDGLEAQNGVENSNGLEVLNGGGSHDDKERYNKTIPKNGIRNKLLEQVVRTPGRMPSPQPTHLSVASGAVHRVLQEEGPGYVAPKFEGKELQMDQGEIRLSCHSSQIIITN